MVGGNKLYYREGSNPFRARIPPPASAITEIEVDAIADDVAAEVMGEGGEGGTEAQAAPMGVGRVEQSEEKQERLVDNVSEHKSAKRAPSHRRHLHGVAV
jgi:hypothetical protein